MNYIMCSGGLGNQMFQYSFYYAQRKNRDDIAFDTSFYLINKCHNNFELNRCFGISDVVTNIENVKLSNRMKYIAACKLGLGTFMNVQVEQNGRYITEINSKSSLLFGYWQSECYFQSVSDDIRRLFTFEHIDCRNISLAKNMLSENSVAIHIRRGDYLSAKEYINLSNTDYYQKSLEVLRKKSKNLSIYIFSDDPAWCKHSGIFPLDACYVDWNKGLASYQDMYLMKCAKHIIIANSTFSWWAAYLGEHETIIRPSVYMKSWDHFATNSFYPKTWINIETIY